MNRWPRAAALRIGLGRAGTHEATAAPRNPATIAAFRNGTQGADMGEQRREKMVKKPKKDTSPPKTGTPSDRPQPPVTAVRPKGKTKNKQ
jgi:hypothetical protein